VLDAKGLAEVWAVLEAVFKEMIRAERVAHGPFCEGREAVRELLAFYMDRVLERLRSSSKQRQAISPGKATQPPQAPQTEHPTPR